MVDVQHHQDESLLEGHKSFLLSLAVRLLKASVSSDKQRHVGLLCLRTEASRLKRFLSNIDSCEPWFVSGIINYIVSMMINLKKYLSGGPIRSGGSSHHYITVKDELDQSNREKTHEVGEEVARLQDT
ncbi:hypothetical protein RF11_08826 [Thelohanellus kitauei]|uniref:Uncharacterized protein n=1 Tax=Thelohanellus kitauei TaxID=669202 RepID=A0A0C2MJD0_THEKT|nr:hypothetical protein RF11_08826 [Thelohanellus kitauei]